MTQQHRLGADGFKTTVARIRAEIMFIESNKIIKWASENSPKKIKNSLNILSKLIIN